MKSNFFTGLVLGVAIAALVFALQNANQGVALLQEVRAQGQGNVPDDSTNFSSGSGGYIIMSGKIQAGNKDVLYLVDTANKRLAVYEYEPNSLKLGAVRNINFDLQLDEYPPGSQRPNAADVKKMLKKD